MTSLLSQNQVKNCILHKNISSFSEYRQLHARESVHHQQGTSYGVQPDRGTHHHQPDATALLHGAHRHRQGLTDGRRIQDVHPRERLHHRTDPRYGSEKYYVVPH